MTCPTCNGTGSVWEPGSAETGGAGQVECPDCDPTEAVIQAEAAELAAGVHCDEWQTWTRPQLVTYLAEALVLWRAMPAGEADSEALDIVEDVRRLALAEMARLRAEAEQDAGPSLLEYRDAWRAADEEDAA